MNFYGVMTCLVIALRQTALSGLTWISKLADAHAVEDEHLQAMHGASVWTKLAAVSVAVLQAIALVCMVSGWMWFHHNRSLAMMEFGFLMGKLETFALTAAVAALANTSGWAFSEEPLHFSSRLALGGVNMKMILAATGVSQNDIDNWKSRFSGKIGNAPQLTSDYKPKQDSSHFRLGVTLEGMLQILERISFIKKSDKKSETISSSTEDLDRMWALGGHWVYCTEYRRPADASWLDKKPGKVRCGGEHGLQNMVGYDACFYVRNWLKTNCCDDRTTCNDRALTEVVLTTSNWTDSKPQIGIANIFWSHLQGEPLLGKKSTLESIRYYVSLRPATMFFIWLDYFCLRQCLKDFEKHVVIEAIHLAGSLVACIDSDLIYPKRRFACWKASQLLSVATTASMRLWHMSPPLTWPTNK